MVAAVLDKLWDDYKRRQMHEVHGGTGVNQSQGGVWPPQHIGTDGMPLINTQTGERERRAGVVLLSLFYWIRCVDFVAMIRCISLQGYPKATYGMVVR